MYLQWRIFFFINLFLTSDNLLIESTKSGDYEILKKGAERADGINDVEEFKITEVSVLLQKGRQSLKFTRNLGNPSLATDKLLIESAKSGDYETRVNFVCLSVILEPNNFPFFIKEGRFNRGFFALRVWGGLYLEGLIREGAYFQKFVVSSSLQKRFLSFLGSCTNTWFHK